MTAPVPEVRQTVRDLLLSSEAYHALDPEKKREMAQAMVKVCQTAVSLLQEEAEPVKAQRHPMAMAQGAGQQFSGVATDKLAGTTRAVLNAVSFPRFVTELINGVFKALIDSNQQQMQSYVELIKNVAASTEGFADLNMAPTRARQWLIDTFPGSLEMSGGPDEDTDPRDVAEEQEDARLRWKEGGTKPSEQALRTALGLEPSESVPSGDPETTLVPFARRALAKQRQGMLSTMVMLGMQRIVIESGRLNASMRFHIDTRSAANSEDASRFDFQNKTEASGKLGFGPWGMEAKMTNTIGYVSTQKNQTTEEMNTDVDLNSSVELYFKTDYLPLDRMAGKGQVDRIKVNTLNPDAEEKDARQAREQRTADARKAERSGMTDLDKSLVQNPISTPKTDESPAKTDAAKKAPDAKADTAKTDPAKTDAAKTDTAKTDPAKTDAAKKDPAKADAPKGAAAKKGAKTVTKAVAHSLGEEPKRELDVPYVPTPEDVVEGMLNMAGIKKGDILYDLGCGDGRIVIAAAQKFGIRGVGIDIDPARIEKARANAEEAGVTRLVKFIEQDLFEATIGEATVVTLYLLPSVNLKLRPKLYRELKPGTRIVSHRFDMGDWKPEKQQDVSGETLYYWVIK